MRQQKQKAVVFSGGLDVVTSQLSIEEGRLLECRNYECDLNGGYRQFAGYERFDGRTAPSAGEYVTILFTAPSGPFTLGETITGGTSAATGVLFYEGADALYLGAVTGAFVEAEALTGGTSAATATSTTPSYANVVVSANDTRNDIRFRKENFYRDFIQPIPGQLVVRGAIRHLSETIAARDLNGSQKTFYKSTTAGWTAIDTCYTIFYDTKVGGQDIPLPGSSIDDGAGNTATVFRTGSNLVSEDSGYITLSGYTAGFANLAALRFGAVQFATITASGAATQFTPTNGGRLEFRQHTFSGSPQHYRLYMTDNVNPAMEYDPIANLIGPIYTDLNDIDNDTPKFLEIYKNHLFLGYERGIMRNSEPGIPYLWDAAAGTLEITVGSEVTGMQSNASSLIVATRRTIFALRGSSSADFVFDIAGQEVGAKPYTMNMLGTAYMMDDRGIIELNRVETFGNFESGTVSRKIQPVVRSLVNNIQATCPNLSNNIIRFFTSDGDGISMTLQEGQVFGFGTYTLGTDLHFITNSEDEQGFERTFFGGLNGFVYEMDKGVNFDGADKECWMQTTYSHLGSPIIRKRFFRAYFSGIVEGESTIQMVAQYANGSSDVGDTFQQSDTAVGNKAGWDIGTWDNMIFDAASRIGDVYLDLTGTGDSISIIVYSKTTQDDILTLRDALYSYKPRRVMRRTR